MPDAKNYVGEVLHGCARCGGEHEGVVYMPLERPARLSDEVVVSHWAPCPTNGEPILMLIGDRDIFVRELAPAPGNSHMVVDGG